MMTPDFVAVVLVRSNVAGGKPSAKSRCPLPRTIGCMDSRYSSIRPLVAERADEGPTAHDVEVVARGVLEGGDGGRDAVGE